MSLPQEIVPQTEFKVGDIVRSKKGGRTFELEDVNDNPNWKSDDEYFATGMSEYGTEDVLDPEDIELVMNAAAARDRKLPTAEELADEIGMVLHGGWGDIVNVDETETEPGGIVLVYGEAHNGLRMAFKVTISEVERTDF